eukprot:3380822-Rhodomonas_salina.2
MLNFPSRIAQYCPSPSPVLSSLHAYEGAHDGAVDIDGREPPDALTARRALQRLLKPNIEHARLQFGEVSVDERDGDQVGPDVEVPAYAPGRSNNSVSNRHRMVGAVEAGGARTPSTAPIALQHKSSGVTPATASVQSHASHGIRPKSREEQQLLGLIVVGWEGVACPRRLCSGVPLCSEEALFQGRGLSSLQCQPPSIAEHGE